MIHTPVSYTHLLEDGTSAPSTALGRQVMDKYFELKEQRAAAANDAGDGAGNAAGSAGDPSGLDNPSDPPAPDEDVYKRQFPLQGIKREK